MRKPCTYADVDAFPREEVEMNKNKCYDVVTAGVKGRRVATKESSNRKMILAFFIVTIYSVSLECNNSSPGSSTPNFRGKI